MMLFFVDLAWSIRFPGARMGVLEAQMEDLANYLACCTPAVRIERSIEPIG